MSWRKLYISAFYLKEGMLWMLSELRHGHTGKYGTFFEQFLCRRVLQDKYRPRQLVVALYLILVISLADRQRGPLFHRVSDDCLKTAIRCHPSELPLERLSVKQLCELRQWSGIDNFTNIILRLDEMISARNAP